MITFEQKEQARQTATHGDQAERHAAQLVVYAYHAQNETDSQKLRRQRMAQLTSGVRPAWASWDGRIAH